MANNTLALSSVTRIALSTILYFVQHTHISIILLYIYFNWYLRHLLTILEKWADDMLLSLAREFHYYEHIYIKYNNWCINFPFLFWTVDLRLQHTIAPFHLWERWVHLIFIIIVIIIGTWSFVFAKRLSLACLYFCWRLEIFFSQMSTPAAANEQAMKTVIGVLRVYLHSLVSFVVGKTTLNTHFQTKSFFQSPERRFSLIRESLSVAQWQYFGVNNCSECSFDRSCLS